MERIYPILSWALQILQSDAFLPLVSQCPVTTNIVEGELTVSSGPMVSRCLRSEREEERGSIHKLSTERSEFKHSSPSEDYLPSKDSIWSSFGPYVSGADNSGLTMLREHSTSTPDYTIKHPQLGPLKSITLIPRSPFIPFTSMILTSPIKETKPLFIRLPQLEV